MSSPRLTATLGCVLAVFASSTAIAEPVRVDLAGQITATDVVTLSPGDSFTMSIFVDSQAADEDAASNVFLASAPGTAVYQFNDFTPGTADVLSVSADSSAGAWTGDLMTTTGAFDRPIDIVLGGLGQTPDQILPDFTSFTSATAYFDLEFVPFGSFIDIGLTSLEIVILPSPIPAASAPGRLMLILLVLGTAYLALRLVAE